MNIFLDCQNRSMYSFYIALNALNRDEQVVRLFYV